MRQLVSILAVALVVLVPGLASAQDEEDVREAMLSYISGWNNGDASTVARYMYPGSTAFPQGSGIQSAPFDEATIQAGMDDGATYNLSFRNMEVQVYGGDTAVVTAYEAGTILTAAGVETTGPWRYSAVWIKDGNQWKQVHRHASPLIAGDTP